ncbi:MAG: hypothetical protein PHF31_14065, partial [Methylobacter sp.]|nr:hypothetical protein [Methylobacter sp.]
MLLTRIILLAALCCLTAGCAKPDSFPSGQWIDLSYDYSSETIYWPTAEAFKLDTVTAGVT